MIASSILNSVTFKKLESYPVSFPNMWNTLHSQRSQSTNLKLSYYQKFQNNHVLYLQFISDTDSIITLKSFSGVAEIESFAIAWNSGTFISTGRYTSGTHYGTDNNRYYTNFVVTLDADYKDKCVYFTATQGTNVLTSEPIFITDLTEAINNGSIKYIKYTNLDRIESDLDDRFIDWSALANTGNYLDFFIEAIDIDLSDSDSSEVLEGSQSKTILSASYYTGRTLKTSGIPDYMVARLGMASNLDIFMVNGIQYVKDGEIDQERFGNSTLYQVSINLTQKLAIGINVDSLGIGESTPVIIPESSTKIYAGLVTVASPDEAEIKTMSEYEAIKQTTEHSYYDVLGSYFCFAYPSSFGNLQSAYIVESFELIGAFVKTTDNFTFGTNIVEMNIYTYIVPITFVPDPPLLRTLTYKFTP